MIATANQSVSGFETTDVLAPIHGNRIEVESLRLFKIEKKPLKLLQPQAIAQAIPIILAKMKKAEKKDEKKIVGGFVASMGTITPTYTRIVHMPLVPAIHEKHPQFVAIKGIPDWCIIVHQRTCGR